MSPRVSEREISNPKEEEEEKDVLNL